MPLHALEIVKEEFATAYQSLRAPAAEAEIVLSNCEDQIVDRIKKECIEQPDPNSVEEAERLRWPLRTGGAK